MGSDDESQKDVEKLVSTQLTDVFQIERLSSKAALMQIIFAVIANISILSSGIGIGFPATTLPLLNEKSTDIKLSQSQTTWFASITAISSPLGGLISGYFLEKVGRKSTLIYINVISILSWLIIAFSSKNDAMVLFIQLMIARFIIGVAIGMSSSPASVYAAEISHPNLRGRLTLLSALFTALGMLFAYSLGYFIPNFRTVSLISAGFTLFALLCLWLVPESPSWLVIKGKKKQAQNVLSNLRGYDIDDHRISKEIETIENTSKLSSAAVKNSKWRELGKPQLYKPLAIMIAFFAFQQFSGIFVIFVYAAQFSEQAGVSIDPFLSAVYIGLTRVVTTILMAFISDKFGRKPPARFSGFGMFFSMLGLALTARFPLKDTSFNWIPTILIVFFIFAATLGFLTLPFSMIAEVFPQNYRGFCAGLTICAGYFMSFINIKIYPNLVENLGNEVIFAFYGLVSLLGVLFVHFILIETKGKTLQEIENHFRGQEEKRDIEMLAK